ncbi:Alkali-sensitive linkage protein 1 [Erysiphe neolycopersici]|uniref:Alkali-sensitive linkage protein 1 n=1 Tax=Erysiphe neolycopersici TaxID=212602 RepID=A0A420HIH8_9PEZI|nr:Alkali-sensitive linkage protein 1 [Erysiphe neolycopersici]
MYSVLIILSAIIILFNKLNVHASPLISNDSLLRPHRNNEINSAKRGLAFHDPSTYVQNFNGEGSKVRWAYNWYSATDNIFPKYLEFVPMLWDHVRMAQDRGTTHLLSFNEPEACSDGGSCMTPEAAAIAYMKYLQPFAGSFRLGAPAVTNGPDGILWLDKFMQLCSQCTIDFMTVHWYDSATNSEYFRSYLQQLHDLIGLYNIWITEFSARGTLEEQIKFLAENLPWMDELPWIERYAWFWCDPSTSQGSLVDSGAALTSLGVGYAYRF